MAGVVKKLKNRGVKAVRALYQEAETRVLVAEDRKSVRRKTKVAVAVTTKAAKTGMIAGLAAAAAVVIHQVRKRRIPD
ncbi:MAG: hypothetical protein EXR94_14535 [Gemmatimonadetes bacterium]|nr:hypothetical protein [Gemmatimonadota bacterium]